MPAIPTLAMPDLVSGPAKLGSSLKEGFNTLAAAFQQYGDFKTDKEKREKVAAELESLGAGTGATWASATKELPIEDAMRGAANAKAYYDKLVQIHSKDPGFVPSSNVKSTITMLVGFGPKEMYTLMGDLDKQAAEAKTQTAQTRQQEILRDLSKGLNSGEQLVNPMTTQGGMGASGDISANRPGVSEVPASKWNPSGAEFAGKTVASMPGARIASQTTREAAMQGVSQVANPMDINKQNLDTFKDQFQTGKDLNAQVAKKEALAISKYRAKNAAESSIADKSLKEKMLAIVAGKTNLEAQDRRQMIGILEQDARIKAADPMLEPGQKQEWLQKADDYNNVLEYSQQNAEVLQDVTSGLFAAIAKKYPDMATRRPKDVVPKTKSGKTGTDFLSKYGL